MRSLNSGLENIWKLPSSHPSSPNLIASDRDVAAREGVRPHFHCKSFRNDLNFFLTIFNHAYMTFIIFLSLKETIENEGKG